jgi:DNA polymerase I-like protein with 3'-5' exonuclease and polymerase domains
MQFELAPGIFIAGVEAEAQPSSALTVADDAGELNAPKKKQSKASRLTVKQQAYNNTLPEGRDYIEVAPLTQFIKRFDPTKPIAFDTESSYDAAIKVVHLSQKALRFVQFSQVQDDGSNLTAIVRVCNDNKAAVTDLCRIILCNPAHKLIIHNATFDQWVLKRFLGLEITALIIDTFVMSRFYYLGRGFTHSNGLGECVARELHVFHDKSEQTADWRLAVSDEQYAYMKRDVELLTPLALALMQKFNEDPQGAALAAQLKVELLYSTIVCNQIHLNGMEVDINKMQTVLHEKIAQIGPLEEALNTLVNPDGELSTKDKELKHTALCKIGAARETLAVKVNTYLLEGGKFPAVKALLKTIKTNQELIATLVPKFNFRSSAQKMEMLRSMYHSKLMDYYRENAAALMAVDSTSKVSTVDLTELLVASDDEEEQTTTGRDFNRDQAALKSMLADPQMAKGLSQGEMDRVLPQIAEKFAATMTEAALSSSGAGNLKTIQYVLDEPDDGALGTLLRLQKLDKERQMLESYIHLAIMSPTGNRLHSAFKSLGADSGRTSSTAPNQQNVKRGGEMRGLFVGTEGFILGICDYSQIEWRVAAELANEEIAIKAFADGMDLHTLTALMIWGDDIKTILVDQGVIASRNIDEDELYRIVYRYFDDYPEVPLNDQDKVVKGLIKDFRQLAKSANFGLIFGAGWRGLQSYIFNSSGKRVSELDCRAIRTRFFAQYRGLASWHKERDRVAQSKPQAIWIGDCVRRWTLPIETSSGYKMPNPSLRLTVLANTPVQGLASVIAKLGTVAAALAIRHSEIGGLTAEMIAEYIPQLIPLTDAILAGGLAGIRMVNIVHDEVVFELPKSDKCEQQLAQLAHLLEAAGQYLLTKVQIKSSFGLADKTNTWADK